MPERAAMIGGKCRCGARLAQARRWNCGSQAAPSMRTCEALLVARLLPPGCGQREECVVRVAPPRFGLSQRRSSVVRQVSPVSWSQQEDGIAQASNGRDAITQFRPQRPDVTMMDIQMPERRPRCAIAMRSESRCQMNLLTTYDGTRTSAGLKPVPGLPAEEHAPFRFLQTTRGPCGREFVARSVVPVAEHERSAPRRKRSWYAPDRGRQRKKEIADQLAITETRSRGVRAFLRNWRPIDSAHADNHRLRRGIKTVDERPTRIPTEKSQPAHHR